MTEPSKWVDICRNGPLTPLQVAQKMAGGHSVYSPSGSEMSMTCPDSVWLNAVAEDGGTFEAAQGTVAHHLAEQWIKTGEQPVHEIGNTIEASGYEIEVTEDMLEFVGDFVRLCQRESEGADFCESEKYVSTSHLTPIPDQGGTMDFTALFPGRMTIIDLKYGMEKVEAVYTDPQGKRQINKQLAVYASGVFREWDWLYGFQEIKIIISQPRLPEPVSEVTITRGELLEFEEYAKDRWALTWKPRDQLTRVPSLKGCRWCAARADCSALYWFLYDATDVFDSDDDRESGEYDHGTLVSANDKILDVLEPAPFREPPDPRSLTTEAMAKLLRYRKLMENFFNSIERELLNRAITNEEDIPYWKVVEGRANRRFVDDLEFVKATVEQLGLPVDQLYKTVMLSPAQFETALHTALNKGKKKGDRTRVSLDKVKAMVQESGLTVKPFGQKTLAPSSDSRYALPKDGDVFDSWDED